MSLKPALYYCTHAATVALVLAALPPFHEAPLRVPVTYEGDGLFFTALVKAVSEDGPLYASRIGAPFGSDLVDWPVGMWVPLAVMAGITRVSGEAGTAINLYWLGSVVVAAPWPPGRCGGDGDPDCYQAFSTGTATGPNPELSYKAPSDTDVYGLKLRHLLLPIGDHPVPALRRISAKVWAAAFPGENENASARLGTAGALGFLALLGLVLGRAAGLLPSRDEDLDGAAVLTLSTLLVAVVGGYGSLISVFVSPEIWAYNRIVVFLSFFSVFALGKIAARAVERFRFLPRLPPAVRPLALGALLVGGVLDQVPVMELGAGRGGSDSQFAEDRAFTRLIEASLPAGAMVFQLPHASIPVDRGSRSRMKLYDPGRAYLHSRSLRWSWGSVIGRTHDWQAAVGALPPRDMLPLLAVAGFSGVWVDRNGYSTGPGLRFDTLENELAEVSGETPVVSSRGRYSYLSIELYRRRLERELGPERLERRRLELLSDAPVLRLRKGCSDEKPVGESWSRTCGRATSLVLNNPAWIDIEVTLSGRIRPIADGRGGVLRFSAPGLEDEVDLATGMAPYRRVLVLKGAQRLRMNLEYEGACAESTGDCYEVLDLRASTRPARRVVPSVVDGARPGG